MENKVYDKEINPIELVEVLKKIEQKLQSQRGDINYIFNLLQDTIKTISKKSTINVDGSQNIVITQDKIKTISEKSTQATKDKVENELNREEILIIVEKKHKELIQKYTKNVLFFENTDYKAVSNEFAEFILNEIKRNSKTTNTEVMSQNEINQTQETQTQEQNDKIVIDEAINEKQELLDKLEAKNQEIEDKNKRIAELEEQLKMESKVRNRIIESKKEIEREKENMPDKKRQWLENKEKQERILDKNYRSKVEILDIQGSFDGK
ncbi:hypothetical protein JF116_09165 [Campylobacter fetus subsp. venerealis]|uniref:hypothetical protein n=1 Tax=Campylobacter fetus TaxID=196 RepID=UPI0019092272|nr:hypothetical protein [Campylobacter fetus]MBK3487549.1 hypothetical protein [Campylobacter fetus subsp. venerealis]